MTRYHVKADGSMGVCTANEGHCPFGGDAGTKHFTSESEAQAYAEKIVKTTNNGGMKMKKTKMNEVKRTTYPTTPHGVHQTSYSGWAADSWAGEDAIISAGGYVNGHYVSSSEVESAGLWDELSEDVKAEMAPLAGGDPADWNDKIIELEQSGKVSPKDEELLDALWISAEVFGGEVTVYGTDSDVSEMDEDDFRRLDLHRIDSDDEDEDE